MSSLMIKYSKEIARELTEIAVVLPGAPVKLGDIIHFRYGTTGFPFYKPSPRGKFEVISGLQYLGISPEISEPDPNPDSYFYSSKRSVKVRFDADVNHNKDTDGLDGNLVVNFNSEGSIYFAAIDCETSRINNLNDIAVNLEKHKNSITWRSTFLVTSITTAKRALIMQSNSDSAFLEVSGKVKGLATQSARDIKANSTLKIEKFGQASFLKPWSENVTVFLGLQRFKKKIFGKGKSGRTLNASPINENESQMLASELVHTENEIYTFEPVSALEILDDTDSGE